MSSSASSMLVDRERFDRLIATPTFRGTAHAKWSASRIHVIGGGVLGGRFAVDAARSGASVCVVDPDVGTIENLGTQLVEAGRAKAASIADACDAARPGSAKGLAVDVRHVGIGSLRKADLIVDATDDPTLALPLTLVSNGLAIPLLRVALDGTGGTESGRVLASHGGGGRSCQLCTYSARDLGDALPRTPCPGRGAPGRPPTLAGNAASMVVSGVALLQAQRLIGGNGADLVLDREILVDLDGFALEPVSLSRAGGCLSGHERWDLVPVSSGAAQTTFRDLFDLAARVHGDGAGTVVEPFLHPLCVAADCTCGAAAARVGTAWAAAPACPSCGAGMRWRTEIAMPRFGRYQAEAIGALDLPLSRLGLPLDGAMITARSAEREPIRFVLSDSADAVKEATT